MSGRCLDHVRSDIAVVFLIFMWLFSLWSFFFSLDFMLDLIPLLAISWRVSSELLCFVFYWLEHQFPALEAEKFAYIDIMIRCNLRLDYDMATKTIMRT